jgi:phage terminase large subunit-like protein
VQRKIRIERPAKCLFSERKAGRAVGFFRGYLTHSHQWLGQPFILAPWQEGDIREVFGRVDEEGRRQIRTVVEFLPKKNGKSAKAAGVANLLTFADDEYESLVYSAAADREQASLVFDAAAGQVRRNDELRKLSKILDSRKQIQFPSYESVYQVVSREVATKHGPNVHGVIFDEFHTQRDLRLWEVLTFGAGAARQQPLTWAISTAGVTGESPVGEMLWEQCDQILRGVVPCPASFYPIVYAAPTDADWKDEEVWRSCNPALGSFLSLRSVREELQTAIQRPSEQNSFKRLRLNQWTAQDVRWIDLEDWDKGGIFSDVARYEAWVTETIRELKNYQWYIGVDLSTKLDLTAVVAVCLDDAGNFHWLPWFWIPRDNIQDRPNVESEKYREWVASGFITATPGTSIEFASVQQRITRLSEILNVTEIAYDPRFAEQFRQELELEGFTCAEMPQGFKLNEACQEFESAMVAGKVLHGGHPVLRWNADCVQVRQNADGLIKPVKPDRKKSSKRIDGIVAGLMGTMRAIVAPEYAPVGVRSMSVTVA